jgi:4-alpha-glucanotransferase
MRAMGVELMGDLPFVVCPESADVWSRASQFQLHMSLGAPPDDFSADGQDWGLPPYDWLAMEGDDLAWLRARTRHAARLYDRFRLDHVVGYFRQWIRPQDRSHKGRFDPESQDAQSARGRRVLGAVLDELKAANHIEPPRAIAEDLGVIPPFVRVSLRDLGMPGYRVLPWEKDDGHMRDVHAFPRESVAAWSTHDTAPIVSWWHDLPDGDRAQLADRAGVRHDMDEPSRTEALLAYLYRAQSDLALVLAQELLGSGQRINVPATVGASNWSWRLPRAIEDLEADAALAARFEAIKASVKAAGR